MNVIRTRVGLPGVPSATAPAGESPRKALGHATSDGYSGPQPRTRELPADAPEKLKVPGNGPVARMVLTRIASTPDMQVYITFIKGKPSFIFMMAQLDTTKAPFIPHGLFDGRKALVLADRDGVVKDSRFLNVPDKKQAHDVMIPSSLEAAKTLHERGIGLALITNQGGFETGKMTYEDTLSINVRVIQQIADNGGHVDAVFVCPFTTPIKAHDGIIDARKPSAGMTKLASDIARAHKIPTLAMIGDQRTDGVAGQAAGLPFFAVTDANGRWQAELDEAKKKGETLPTLDTTTGRYSEVANFEAAVRAILVKRG